MTHRIRAKRGLGLVALLLLSLGLAGCGSDEPMVGTPPAPTPMDQTVTLGESGSTVTLVGAGGGYTLDGAAFTGGEVQAANGATYALTLAGGTWSAMHVQQRQEVALGDSGNAVTIEQLSEDGAWTIGGMVIMSGGTTTDEGVSYQLTLADGMWSATAAAMSIAGTDLTAVPRADGSGYEVRRGELVLDATLMFGDDNTGEIMLGSMGYLVTKAEDGTLSAARFIEEPGTGSAIGYGAANGEALGNPSLQDGGTTLQLGNIKFPVGELLDTGMTSTEDALFIAEQLEAIEAVRVAVGELDALDDELLPATALEQALAPLRMRVNAALAEMFGEGALILPEGEAEEFVENLELILAALADEEAFVAAATAADGLFAGLGLGEMEARAAYTARKSAGKVTLASTASTSYGTVIAQVFENALDEMPDRTIGAYAYSSLPGTPRADDVPLSRGAATYAGATQAVGGSGTLYEGTIEVQVGFVSYTATAVLRDMVKASGDEVGEPLSHLGEVVRAIHLPSAPMARNTAWSVENGDARVLYRVRPGITTLESTSSTADFAGRLLGRGEQAGSEAAGTWSLGDPAATDDTYLVGAFGAVRSEGSTIMPSDLDFGEQSARSVSAAYTFEDATLPNPDGSPGWYGDGAGTHQTRFFSGMMRVHGVQPRRYLFGGPNGRWDAVRIHSEYVVDNTFDDGARNMHLDIPIEDIELNGEFQQFELGRQFLPEALRVLEESLTTLRVFQVLNLDDAALTATLLASDIDNVWRDAGDALYRVIGGQIDGFGDGISGDPPVGTPDYPTTVENLDDRVTLLKTVIAALQSESALARAFGGGGVFSSVGLLSVEAGTRVSPDDDAHIDPDALFTSAPYPDRNHSEGDYSYTAAELFEHRQFRLSVAMEGTDYTRYGAWYYQARAGANAPLEHRYGPVYDKADTYDGPGWNNNGPAAVAYSPLLQLHIPRPVDSTNAPFLGGTATYQGGALGIFGDIDNRRDTDYPMVPISGDATVVVDWNDAAGNPAVEGSAAMTLSNLVTSDGRSLVWTVLDGEVPVIDGRIDDIIFTDLSFDHIPPGGYGDAGFPGNTVLIEWHNRNKEESPENNNLRLRLADPGRPDVIVTTHQMNVGIIDGDFAGASPAGPLAIVGTLMLSVGRHPDLPNGYVPGIGLEPFGDEGTHPDRARNIGEPLILGWGVELP